MESTAALTRKRVRHNMLRRTDELFNSAKKNKLSWLEKLTMELDMDVNEIVRTDVKLEF